MGEAARQDVGNQADREKRDERRKLEDAGPSMVPDTEDQDTEDQDTGDLVKTPPGNGLKTADKPSSTIAGKRH